VGGWVVVERLPAVDLVETPAPGIGALARGSRHAGGVLGGTTSGGRACRDPRARGRPSPLWVSTCRSRPRSSAARPARPPSANPL